MDNFLFIAAEINSPTIIPQLWRFFKFKKKKRPFLPLFATAFMRYDYYQSAGAKSHQIWSVWFVSMSTDVVCSKTLQVGLAGQPGCQSIGSVAQLINKNSFKIASPKCFSNIRKRLLGLLDSSVLALVVFCIHKSKVLVPDGYCQTNSEVLCSTYCILR